MQQNNISYRHVVSRASSPGVTTQMTMLLTPVVCIQNSWVNWQSWSDSSHTFLGWWWVSRTWVYFFPMTKKQQEKIPAPSISS